MSINLFKNKKIELDKTTINVLQPDIQKTIDYGRISNLEEIYLIKDIEEEYNSSLFFSLDFKNKIYQFIFSPIRMIINIFSLIFISRVRIIFIFLLGFLSYEILEIMDRFKLGEEQSINYKNILCAIGIFVLLSMFKQKLPFFKEFKYVEVFKIIIFSEKYGKVIVYESRIDEPYDDVKKIFDLIVKNVEYFKSHYQNLEEGSDIEYTIFESGFSDKEINDSLEDLQKYL